MLYKNSEVISKFEKFLEKAHFTAQKGNKLKDGYIFYIFN